MNNYSDPSSVNTMINASLVASKHDSCFIKLLTASAIPSDILVPSENRLKKHHSQSYQHIQTFKDT